MLDDVCCNSQLIAVCKLFRPSSTDHSRATWVLIFSGVKGCVSSVAFFPSATCKGVAIIQWCGSVRKCCQVWIFCLNDQVFGGLDSPLYFAITLWIVRATCVVGETPFFGKCGEYTGSKLGPLSETTISGMPWRQKKGLHVADGVFCCGCFEEGYF